MTNRVDLAVRRQRASLDDSGARFRGAILFLLLHEPRAKHWVDGPRFLMHELEAREAVVRRPRFDASFLQHSHDPLQRIRRRGGGVSGNDCLRSAWKRDQRLEDRGDDAAAGVGKQTVIGAQRRDCVLLPPQIRPVPVRLRALIPQRVCKHGDLRGSSRRWAKRKRQMAPGDVDNGLARPHHLSHRNAQALKLRVRNPAAAEVLGQQIRIRNHALRNYKAEYIHVELQSRIIRKCVH